MIALAGTMARDIQAPTYAALEADNRDLRRQVGELQDQLVRAKAALRGDMTWPVAWGVTPLETRMLNCLYLHERVRTEALLTAAYDAGDVDRGRIHLRAKICHLRRKLKPHGVDIIALWGYGYQVPDEGRAILRRVRDAVPTHG